MTELSFTDLH